MSRRTQAEHAPLPRRVRSGHHHTPNPRVRADAPTCPDDLSELSEAVRRLLRQRPDLARPVPGDWGALPLCALVGDLLTSLPEVHGLALSIGAHEEAADIARLIGVLRRTA
ncbi:MULTISPECIES: hypothetical protein [unclassified Nocardiopsis]|uniref:hypothetical protein n=1 Tax=unclassified Nocardiopsis TaxID=2649073 RepID=UPI0013596B05|nr:MULTISPECIES: hypothetical protein [unclassified Nocardiopsis]